MLKFRRCAESLIEFLAAIAIFAVIMLVLFNFIAQTSEVIIRIKQTDDKIFAAGHE